MLGRAEYRFQSIKGLEIASSIFSDYPDQLGNKFCGSPPPMVTANRADRRECPVHFAPLDLSKDNALGSVLPKQSLGSV